MNDLLSIEIISSLGLLEDCYDLYEFVCSEYLQQTFSTENINLSQASKRCDLFLEKHSVIFLENVNLHLNRRLNKIMYILFLSECEISQNTDGQRIDLKNFSFTRIHLYKFLNILSSVITLKVNEILCKMQGKDITIEETKTAINNHLQKLSAIEEQMRPLEKLPPLITIYIYKTFSNLRCRKESHNVIDKNALIKNLDGTFMKLHVQYCNECDRYFVNYYVLESVEKNGLLLFQHNTTFLSFNERYNNESLLHRYGYNVVEGKLTVEERHKILTHLIDYQIMSKFQISCDINNALHIFGYRSSYRKACQKWISDLKFIEKYNNVNETYILGKLL